VERAHDGQLNHEIHVIEQTLKAWFLLVDKVVDKP
jgi:hypothetical protein